MLTNEKIKQASQILNELNIDLWLTFVRESASTPDPILDLILDTQCTWASAFLIHRNGEAVAIVGSLDAQNIKDHADYHVMTYVDSIEPELMTIIKQWDPQQIAINYSENDVMADGLSHGMYLNLLAYFDNTPYQDRLQSSEPVIAALRGRKSASEVENIKLAIKETLDIFDMVTGHVKIGITEKAVAEFIKIKMQEKGLNPAWDPTHCPAVFTGPDSAGAHAGPTDRKIEPGHIMNIDFGVQVNGYVSDLQRTWYFLKPGEKTPPDHVIHGFNTIKEAIQKAANFLKPGVLGWEVDHIARQYIIDACYEEYPHALGHQVGRKAHDGSTLLCPKWERYKNLPYSKVEAGQVFTIEPRLTVKNHGIATIEEIVYVTENETNFLSDPQKEIYII